MDTDHCERILVVSPHCDDAVFSCGALLDAHPGAVVATVCAGRPPVSEKLTEWDEASGFRPGDDVMGLRRAEDRAALAVLRAEPVWLEFCDSQYGRSPDAHAVAGALEEVIRRTGPDAVVFPLGLFHDDHKLAHRATLDLRAHVSRSTPVRTPAWVMYEDAIYRRYTGLVQERLSGLSAAGVIVTPIAWTDQPSGRKRAAVACYASQLRALCTPGRPGYGDVFGHERYWRVEPCGAR